MPAEVQVTKASELDEGTGQTEGMIRKGAIIGKSQNICASVMVAHPHTSSAVHHHGEQVYALSGHGAIISNDGKTRQELSPGDFALVPAWTEHQEANEGEEEVTWIISRSGGTPAVVNLEGWGGGEIRERK